MSKEKKRVVVVCPGRGSYTGKELGYLKRYGKGYTQFISNVDQERKKLNETTVTEMDSAEKFRVSLHTPGENASPLIYACAMIDFFTIDRDQFEIVAVCGNSMGWYLTLAAAEALDESAAFQVVNTMGSMMKSGVIGGQILYPTCNDEWQHDETKVDHINSVVAKVSQETGEEVHRSIHLGGFEVLAGSHKVVSQLMKTLEPLEERYPMKLVNHAAFHTPLLNEVSTHAREILPATLFKKPATPMIDGRGHIWQPHSTNVRELHSYTLDHQVCQTYDFTKSVEVALKELAPDHLILLGPGSSLGPPVAQVMIEHGWKNIRSKSEFQKMQERDPFLIAMGREEQRL